MIRLFRLWRDDQGVAIIELALIAPVFALLTIGVIDLSGGYSEKLKLEQAAQRTIEKAQQTKVDETMIATLTAEGSAAAGVPATDVIVDHWLECNGVRQAQYDTVCPNGETFARYLTVKIEKSYSPYFAKKFAGANADGTYTLTGKAGIRTQ